MSGRCICLWDCIGRDGRDGRDGGRWARLGLRRVEMNGMGMRMVEGREGKEE